MSISKKYYTNLIIVETPKYFVYLDENENMIYEASLFGLKELKKWLHEQNGDFQIDEVKYIQDVHDDDTTQMFTSLYDDICKIDSLKDFQKYLNSTNPLHSVNTKVNGHEFGNYKSPYNYIKNIVSNKNTIGFIRLLKIQKK